MVRNAGLRVLAFVYVVISLGWLVVQPLRGVHFLGGVYYRFWIVAARILAMGSHCIYCPGTQSQMLSSYLKMPVASDGISPFLDHPVAAFVLLPLSGIEPHLSYLIFSLISLGCIAVSVWMLQRWVLPGTLRSANRWLIATALIATVPAAYGMWFGEWDSIFLLPAVSAVVIAKLGRPFWAGLVLSLIFVKPQIIWMVPVVLLGTRQWRAFIGMAVGGVAFVAMIPMIIGFDHFLDWPQAIMSAFGDSVETIGIPGLVGEVLSSPTANFYCAVGLGIGTAALAVAAGARFRIPLDTAIALGISVSLLTSPHVWPYGLILLAVPLAVLANDRLVAACAIAVGATVIQLCYLGINDYPHAELLCPAAATIGIVMSLTRTSTPRRGRAFDRQPVVIFDA